MADLLQLEWEGKQYELDVESVTAREFKTIKQHTGLKAGQFVHGLMDLDDLDGDIAVALMWLFRKRGGESNPEFEDDLPIFQLFGAISRPDVPVEDEEDPKE